MEQLLSEVPENAEYAHSLGKALHGLAHVYAETNRDDLAKRTMRRALETLSAMNADDPQNQDVLAQTGNGLRLPR